MRKSKRTSQHATQNVKTHNMTHDVDEIFAARNIVIYLAFVFFIISMENWTKVKR